MSSSRDRRTQGRHKNGKAANEHDKQKAESIECRHIVAVVILIATLQLPKTKTFFLVPSKDTKAKQTLKQRCEQRQGVTVRMQKSS
jgi:hypothetical protein